MKELGDKLSEKDKKSVEEAIAAVREALKGDNVDKVKTAYDNLQNRFQKVSEELYKQAAASASAQAGPQPGTGAREQAGGEKKADKGDVVDAEFEMVDEDKKK